ncbi:S-methyl-5-thioribose-1-phosphate isomerase [Candidatus Bathyarchaeota archaeon]|nr:MAG: S-methyl-5-thioribose-1-phosphate isomerase [Candidatus Bathyarchaeota archaeon]
MRNSFSKTYLCVKYDLRFSWAEGKREVRTIEWRDGAVITIDQTKLPIKEEIIELKSPRDIADAIREMKIRGAPLIGVAAAYGLALAAYHSKAVTRDGIIRDLEDAANLIKSTRPTAVNLFWAVDRILKRAYMTPGGHNEVKKAVISEAVRMADEDVEVNRRIGKNGSTLLRDGDTVLTHCNAGSLATVDYGTALAVIRSAWEEGKRISVVADETRPKLQGARLTAYELIRDGIPVTLITDNMVGYVMAQGLIDKVIVGADRIVKDAVINKIGTYTVAVLAKEHGVPFYVAAPKSTFDLERESSEVTIEMRSPDEVTHIGGLRIAPAGVNVINPAFDVTPIKYVDAIICEEGVITREIFLEMIGEKKAR